MTALCRVDRQADGSIRILSAFPAIPRPTLLVRAPQRGFSEDSIDSIPALSIAQSTYKNITLRDPIHSAPITTGP